MCVYSNTEPYYDLIIHMMDWRSVCDELDEALPLWLSPSEIQELPWPRVVVLRVEPVTAKMYMPGDWTSTAEVPHLEVVFAKVTVKVD